MRWCSSTVFKRRHEGTKGDRDPGSEGRGYTSREGRTHAKLFQNIIRLELMGAILLWRGSWYVLVVRVYIRVRQEIEALGADKKEDADAASLNLKPCRDGLLIP